MKSTKRKFYKYDTNKFKSEGFSMYFAYRNSALEEAGDTGLVKRQMKIVYQPEHREEVLRQIVSDAIEELKIVLKTDTVLPVPVDIVPELIEGMTSFDMEFDIPHIENKSSFDMKQLGYNKMSLTFLAHHVKIGGASDEK